MDPVSEAEFELLAELNRILQAMKMQAYNTHAPITVIQGLDLLMKSIAEYMDLIDDAIRNNNGILRSPIAPFADYYNQTRKDLLDLIKNTKLKYRPAQLKPGQKIPNKGEVPTMMSREKPPKPVPITDSKQLVDAVPLMKHIDFHPPRARLMTKKLFDRTEQLTKLVKSEWPDARILVKRTWESNHETTETMSWMHHEARAIDIQFSDGNTDNLGRLGQLAVYAGFEWVGYNPSFENGEHIHGSVPRDQ